MSKRPKKVTARPEDLPRSLPRGPHALPRDLVVGSQRRRLMDAIVAVAAVKGYPATSVADILKRAGVSRLTFYEQFKDKEDCFLAAYAEGGDVHYRHVIAAAATGGTPLEQLTAGAGAYVGMLASQPEFARTFLLEIVAAGPRALAKHDELQDRYVARLERLHSELRREYLIPPLPGDVFRAATAGVDGLLVRALREGRLDELPDLVPAVRYLLLAALGVPRAAELARADAA